MQALSFSAFMFGLARGNGFMAERVAAFGDGFDRKGPNLTEIPKKNCRC
jgi:hypothetical protein